MGRGLPALLIAIALAALWFTLSGRTELQLLVLGAASIAAVLLLLRRMEILDGETSGFRRPVSLLFYWAWLGGEIFKANVAVARAILKIDLDLSPTMVRVRALQRTDYGRMVFANSITLTPGTVTVEIDGGDLVVHALTEAMAEPAGFEAMNRKAARAVEGRAP